MNYLRKSIWILTGIMITVPLMVFGIVHWYQDKFDRLPVLGGNDVSENGIPVQHTISPFEFENQDGKIFSSDGEKNKIIIANFFFTSCAGICPNMMNHVKQVQGFFLQDSDIHFISFTVDPKRDNAPRLKWYAGQFHIKPDNWDLLTGKKNEIYKLARKSFYLTANEGDGGENDFIHSQQLVLIDKSKHIRGYYNGTDDHSMKQLIHDIKKLEHEN